MPVILWMLAACGNEGVIRNLAPVFSVAPRLVAFGAVGPPLSATRELYVENLGAADLLVTLDLTNDRGAFALGTTSLSVSPGEATSVPVTFTPATFDAYAGEITLDSNDADHPRLIVALTGEGVDLPFPDIAIEPSRTIERDEVAAGASALFTFVVANEGDAPLVLGAITVDGPAVFDLTYAPSSFTLAPGDSDTVVVTYTPVDAGGEVATVTVPSNDPDEPATTVLLVGNGGGAFERPVAVVDCPAEVLLTGPEWLHLDGSASFDPAQQVPLTYAWSVVARPPASDGNTPFDPDDTEAVDLYVDVAGTWAVSLVVTNTLGTASAPTTCTFEARPEDDLHVELSWNVDAADVDLHLAQGAAAPFSCPEDCFWDNQNPDWGMPVDGHDDPRLDIDDQNGRGPENINIEAPADGTYDVLVHLFDPRGVPTLTATVDVWLGGALVWSGSGALDQVDELWRVGTVSWPAGTFMPSAVPNELDLSSGCL